MVLQIDGFELLSEPASAPSIRYPDGVQEHILTSNVCNIIHSRQSQLLHLMDTYRCKNKQKTFLKLLGSSLKSKTVNVWFPQGTIAEQLSLTTP